MILLTSGLAGRDTPAVVHTIRVDLGADKVWEGQGVLRGVRG